MLRVLDRTDLECAERGELRQFSKRLDNCQLVNSHEVSFAQLAPHAFCALVTPFALRCEAKLALEVPSMSPTGSAWAMY
jgi:hypothetical protein